MSVTANTPGTGTARPRVVAGVSPLQRRIIGLLAQGASDEHVAHCLGLGLRTVQRHVSYLMHSLGARSRFEAGVAVARAGWLDDGSRTATGARPG